MPSIDVSAILDSIENSDPLAVDLAKRTRDFAQKIGLPAALAETLAKRVGFSVGLVIAAVGLLVSILIAIADPLLRIFLKVLTNARRETVPEQIDISASVLSEFLAVEIDPSHLKTGKTGDATIDAARAIGQALHARLTREFAPSGGVTPESGEAAAQTFSGYAINFAVQNTMIGTLADALSFHLLEDFRELGVEVARNIGLGRLVRLALQPLIRNTIQEPYDQALRKRYRPDILNEQHAVSAFNGQLLDGTALHDTLARKGYSDELQAVVIDQLSQKLTDAELSVLIRNGLTTRDAAIKELGRSGYTPAQADGKLVVNDLQRVDALVSTFKAELVKDYTDGLITEDQFNAFLDQLPITDAEKTLEKKFVELRRQIPRAFLTWAEVETAYENAAVDLSYVDAWLERRGFSEEDIINKELLLLLKFEKDASKAKTAAARAVRKTSPTPPPQG
jgi:hypothetical protein